MINNKEDLADKLIGTSLSSYNQEIYMAYINNVPLLHKYYFSKNGIKSALTQIAQRTIYNYNNNYSTPHNYGSHLTISWEESKKLSKQYLQELYDNNTIVIKKVV